MIPYWITFEDGTGVCIEAESPDKARRLTYLHTPKKITDCQQLPYPAEPRIGKQSDCPAFCTRPITCQGHSACPRSYSCTN